MTGTAGQQRVPKGVFDRLNIPLPSLPIQKQIASILEKADAAREKRRQANELTEQFLQSAFLEMFGDPVTNPKGWGLVAVSEISSHISSGSTPLGGESTYLFAGIDFIRSQNVLMNRLDLINVTHISTQVHNSMKRTWLKSGDVLLNITGASIGRVASYEGPDDGANVNQHVCIIRPMQSVVLPEYLSFLISMSSYQSKILSRNSGATRQAFNFSQVRSFRIALPPLAEQKKFSALVEKVESLRAKQRESEKELDNLFNTLMQKAFNGELVKETIAVPRRFKLSPTDIHVGLLGKIIMAHEARPEHKSTLGHVKGEKICHVIENFLDIDLGRVPKRMAAGPADFPHLLKVESRADKTGRFQTRRREGAEGRLYIGKKNLGLFLQDLSADLGDLEEEVDRIISLFVPMKTDRAEVVATVYAAWNDLLLDGKNPTDDEIVTEARENWTPEKLRIPAESFQKSIEWLRRNGLVPRGKGKHTGR